MAVSVRMLHESCGGSSIEIAVFVFAYVIGLPNTRNTVGYLSCPALHCNAYIELKYFVLREISFS